MCLINTSFTNFNLLDNPWFGSGEVVNQRGSSSWEGAETNRYTIDRWYIGYNGDLSTIALTNDGLNFSGRIWLTQNFEPSLFDAIKGKVATLSCIVDGDVVSGTAIIPTSGTTVFFDNNKVHLYLEVQNNNLVCPINPKTSCTIRAVKLELGSTSTLAHDVAPNYATELLKCQRYFQKISPGWFTGWCKFAPDAFYNTIILRPEMRSNDISASIEAGMFSAGVTAISGDFTLFESAKNKVTFQFVTSSPISDYQNMYMANFNASLSADL